MGGAGNTAPLAPAFPGTPMGSLFQATAPASRSRGAAADDKICLRWVYMAGGGMVKAFRGILLAAGLLLNQGLRL